MKKGVEVGEFRENLGKPYQIYTEIIDKGKNISGTKRKIKWQFGWSDSDTDHEVTVVHSIISGKKTLYENGIEITSSKDVLATEFSYGWNALAGLHVYRLECFFPILGEYSYLFSIDGIRFNNFPRRKGERRYPEKLGSDNKIDGFNVDTNATIVTTNNNKGTGKIKNSNDNNPGSCGSTGGNTVNSKNKILHNIDIDRSDSIDPFEVPEASTNNRKDSFDPFAEEAPKSEVKSTITSVTLTSDDFIEMSDVSVRSTDTNVFDFLNDYNGTQTTTTTTSSSSAIDIFASAPNIREINTISFDNFAASTTIKSTNAEKIIDPFASINATTKPILNNIAHSDFKESEFADKLNVPKKLINFDFSLPENKTADLFNNNTNKSIGVPKSISGVVDPFANLTVKKSAAPFNPSTNPPATTIPSKAAVPINPFAQPVVGGKGMSISSIGMNNISQQSQQKTVAKSSIDQLDWKV